MTTVDPVAEGDAALAAGRWGEARACFERALAVSESAQACFGLACALWWLGDNREGVAQAARAHRLFRRAGNVPRAVQSAVWLAITYKANFANHAAANGWIARAERLLAGVEPGPLHGWARVARAYRMADLNRAEALAAQALELATAKTDVDLELVALSQLGLIRVGQGAIDAGFALIDEATAAALSGEPSSLDTVVYACCDMLTACELASDVERAAQWCKVADDFVELYGCPFLYAECRIYYGAVLMAKGRWLDAERELHAGLRITAGASPGLHARALIRLAGLRIRQGRLEEAQGALSGAGSDVEAEGEQALAAGALLLARGEAEAAARALEHGLRHVAGHRWHLASALDLLVEAHLEAGATEAAADALRRLEALAGPGNDRPRALLAGARGRAASARGDRETAVAELERALEAWTRLGFPFEAARARYDLGRALAGEDREAAVAHARRALAAFEALGAAQHADVVAAFLRPFGVTPRTGHRGAGGLTPREREVLRLLAIGLSNPEIAERLHVSRKTAAHHVSNILTKLNLRNRAEAASYAAAKMGQLPHAR